MKLFRSILILTLLGSLIAFKHIPNDQSWIRINLLGYKPSGEKVAVWCSKKDESITNFQLIDSISGKVVLSKSVGKPFGAYGPFLQSYRLDFSAFTKPGTYYLKAGE